MPGVRLRTLIRTSVAACLVVAWLFSGWPAVWQHPRIPPKVSVAYASSTTFTNSGTWVVPDGVSSAIVETYGSGAGGGVNTNGEGGGGGGAYAKSTLSVTAGDSWTVTVGNGGGAGQSGTATSVVRGGTSVIAAPGSTATGGSGRTGGAGGTVAASTGTTEFAGGAGGTSSGGSAGGGGGGSSAGTAVIGNNGSNNSSGTGGNGGVAPAGGFVGGKGGNNGVAGNSAPGANGGAGGGGGGNGFNAGSGAKGYVVITYSVISVTVTDGTVSYGILGDSATKDTTSSGLNDTQTATNNGDVAEDFNIKGQSSANWTLAGSIGANQYVQKFCTAGSGSPDPCDASPTWTALTTSYQSLSANIAASGTKKFDLQLLTPSSTSSSAQQSVDVTVQAVIH